MSLNSYSGEVSGIELLAYMAEEYLLSRVRKHCTAKVVIVIVNSKSTVAIRLELGQ